MMKSFISKLVTLLCTAIFNAVYFAVFLFPPGENFSTVIYIACIMYPVILLYMSPGILVSYLVNFIKKRTDKTHLLYSVGMYLMICFVLFYVPFLLIHKGTSVHAMFYFLVIPVLYGVLEFFIKKKFSAV
jgi:uncharacterized membrane protein YozB (DUF420 family)